MTKFSSFLVFALGAALIIIVGFNAVRHFMPVQRKPGPEVEVPVSALPPLPIQSKEAFEMKLDKIFLDEGGLDGLRRFVEQELPPGRRLVIAPSHRSEPEHRLAIVDRELRRCDRNGVVLLEEPPVAARTSAKPEVGKDGVLQSWVRPRLEMPVHLTVWCVPVEE